MKAAEAYDFTNKTLLQHLENMEEHRTYNSVVSNCPTNRSQPETHRSSPRCESPLAPPCLKEKSLCYAGKF